MDQRRLPRRPQQAWNLRIMILFLVVFLSLFHQGKTCDLTSPCKPVSKQCVNGKCTTQSNREKPSHTTASLAAVVTVCTILMMCFWGLLCFACFKQCKDCNSRPPFSSCASTTSLAIDISSIDIPDDFFRNARIPSVEQYMGPPPYLQLFHPKVKPEESKTEEEKKEAKPCVTDQLPPQYKALFSDNPPCYSEVIQCERISV